MIANARSTSHTGRAASVGSALALVPPRHSELQVRVLRPGKIFIGTDVGCEIHLEVDGVEARHALIIAGEQKTLLKAIDPRTWVNDHSITESALRPGDRVSIGPVTFTVRRASAEELEELPTAVKQPEVFHAPIEIPVEIQVPPIPAFVPVEQVLPPTITVLKSGFTGIQAHELDSLAPQNEALRIIQKEIDRFEPAATGLNDATVSSHHATEQQRLTVRESELRQLAQEISNRTRHLDVRDQRVTSLEAELEHKQVRFAQDHDRLMKSVQEAQQKLTDECARQTSLWKEWEATYQRSAAEVKAQFESIETHQESLRNQNELLEQKREEIRVLQSECDQLRRELADQKVEVTEELVKLQTQRAAFESERQQHLAELREQQARISDDHRGLLAAQNELQIARSQMESAEAILTSQRSEDQKQRDHEKQRHESIKSRLDETEASLDALKSSLEFQQKDVDQERSLLVRERDSLESERAALQTERAQFEQSRILVSQPTPTVEISSAVAEANREAELQRQRELDQWQQELEAERRELETTRKSIHQEQQALEVAKAEIAAANELRHTSVQSVVSDRLPFTEKKPDDHLPISDAVDQLLDIYGVSSSSTPLDSVETNFSSRISSGIESQFESISPSSFFSNTVESVGIPPRDVHDEFRPGSGDGFDYLRHGDAQSMSTDHYAGTMLADESRLEQQSMAQIDGSQTSEELWRAYELEPADLSCAVVAEVPNPEVDATLLDVNHRFGYLSSNLAETEDRPIDLAEPFPPSQLTDECDNGLDQSNSIIEEQPASLNEQESPAAESDDPLLSLRAKLAQMFDLNSNEDAKTEIHSPSDESAAVADASDGEEQDLESSGIGSSLSGDNAELSSVEHSLPLQEEASVAEASSVQAAFTPAAANSHPATDNSPDAGDEEDNAWTRRLRELSAVAQGSQPAPPPVPKSEPVAAAKEKPKTADDDEEFSVEAQLARLLGKPLSSPAAESEPSPPKVAEPMPVTSDSGEYEISQNVDVASEVDRSHLVAGPRHKQNKDAVREEVQSFRAVAQMSARKALEKHSWKNFKSEFYFSFALLIVSTGAAAWYIGATYYGFEETPWKAVACVLSSLLCGLKLSGLVSRLKGERKPKKARKS